jgi:type I restriction enzyme S subunit
MSHDGWTDISLGDACLKIGSGATPRGGSSVYLNVGKTALIRSQNVYNDGFRQEGIAYISEEHAAELANVEVEEGDVLLNITGDSVARCCQVDPAVLPARVNQHVAIIRPDPARLDARFLRYCMITPRMQNMMLSWAGSGGTRNALTKGMIEAFQVYAPTDIGDQRAIASILGTLDDKIELNRRMNETLEALAQSLFQFWFVSPTRAGLPKGWREGTLGEEFNLTMGQSPPGETYNESGDGLPFYQGRADFGFRYPKVRVYCTAPTRFANAGDSLVSVRAPVGSANTAAEKCAVGRGVAAVRHKSGSRSYTYYFMRALEPEFASFEGEGTVFGSITKAGFHRIRCAVPPADLIEEFEKLVFPLDQRIENNENESRTLGALRDTLLPKLLSGELRIRDIEKSL